MQILQAGSNQCSVNKNNVANLLKIKLYETVIIQLLIVKKEARHTNHCQTLLGVYRIGLTTLKIFLDYQ